MTCHARNQTNRFRTYDVFHARAEDCTACPLRARCLSKPTTSRRYLSVQVDSRQPNLIDEMKAMIDTEQGMQIYARRLGIVEPVFANICVHKRMHRFTLRSKLKVDVQWRLFALVHNIGKIHTFGALLHARANPNDSALIRRAFLFARVDAPEQSLSARDKLLREIVSIFSASPEIVAEECGDEMLHF